MAGRRAHSLSVDRSASIQSGDHTSGKCGGLLGPCGYRLSNETPSEAEHHVTSMTPNLVSDRVNEVVTLRQRPRELDLKIPPRLESADAVILSKALEELDALMQHAVPRASVRVAARAAEILADLGVAVSHQATSIPVFFNAEHEDSSGHWLAGANPSKLSKCH